jgi:hypothetical protein
VSPLKWTEKFNQISAHPLNRCIHSLPNPISGFVIRRLLPPAGEPEQSLRQLKFVIIIQVDTEHRPIHGNVARRLMWNSHYRTEWHVDQCVIEPWEDSQPAASAEWVPESLSLLPQPAGIVLFLLVCLRYVSNDESV